jgi:hypothetical protein
MLILMSICLLANPGNCREERLSFSFEEVNAFACMVRSQEAIAEWQQGHPDWRVKRWKCVARARVPKDA